MKSMIAVLAITLCAGLAQAVELHRATNQELLNEVSNRLGTSGGGTGGGSLVAFCSGDTLNIEVVGTEGSDKDTLYVPNGQCMNQVKKVSSKLGTFSGVRTAAVCAGDTLNRYKATSTGSLSNTTTYIPNGQCNAQADLINGSL